MFSSFEWGVAFRYLKARRGDKFISVIAGFSLAGISLGVMVLIVVMAVMNGFRTELMDRVLGLNGHITVVGFSDGIDGYDELTEAIRQIDGVTRANAFVDGQLMATARGRAAGAYLRGVKPEMLWGLPYVAENVLEGSLDDFGGRDTIAMGSVLANSLGVRVGDQVTLISPEGTSTPFGTAPRMQAFTVVAIFEVGIYDYDEVYVYMPINSAQVYYRLYDVATAIEIFVEDPDDMTAITDRITELSKQRAFVRTWQQMNMSLFSALVVERNVMFIILTLIILVAVFNIISSLIILVKDKSKDVAIMRTMGAGRRSMMKIFVISGATIGIIGTLLGVLLGVIIVINIQPIQDFIQGFFDINLWPAEVRFLTEMPAELRFGEVAFVVIVALLLSFLATLPPSWRAANLDPVEILRHEA